MLDSDEFAGLMIGSAVGNQRQPERFGSEEGDRFSKDCGWKSSTFLLGTRVSAAVIVCDHGHLVKVVPSAEAEIPRSVREYRTAATRPIQHGGVSGIEVQAKETRS